VGLWVVEQGGAQWQWRVEVEGPEEEVGLWVVEQGEAQRQRRVQVEVQRAEQQRRRRGGVYLPSIHPLPHSLLLIFS
jgi:hypothetical protein